MPDEVTLRIGGTDFLGWKTARVIVSLESVSGTFDLEVSERWPAHPARRSIRPGQRAEIRIGKDVLVTGYVNEVTASITGDSHSVSVRGRDAVGDLVDCAPDIADPGAVGPLLPGVMRGEWINVTLLDLARTLAAPFGVDVSAGPDVGLAVAKRFEKVSLSPGQRVFDLLEQQCRYRQVLPVSDGRGGLLLTVASSERISTPLVEGRNVVAATVTYSELERFSRYIVKGQSFDTGLVGANAGESAGYCDDGEVTRHRPLLQQADQAVDAAGCGDRARWEALTRAARAVRVSVDVVGWRQPGGGLWPVNRRVELQSPSLGVSGEFLITEVAYSLPRSICTLTLARPDAFAPAPAEIPKAGFGGLFDDAEA